MRFVVCLAGLVAAALLPLSARADAWTDLRAAVYYNKEAEVVRLLDSGVDINLQNEEGWTALHVAAEQGMLRMVNYLLARGADPNLKTTRGRTAYDVSEGYTEVRAALKARMAPAADPFAPVLGPKGAPPKAAAPKPAAPKPAPKAAAPKGADSHCKKMWNEARALCSINDTSCNMSAHIRYQSCQKKGTWY